nr:hypothetical protein [Corynebacterium diphtheriae]
MDHPRPTQSTDDQRLRGSGVHDIRQDLTVEHVDNKNHVAETAAGVHIHEIHDPPLIGALSLRPSPLNTNQETLRGGSATVVRVVLHRNTPAIPRIFIRRYT